MSEKYLIGEWVAFIQQIQHLVSRGYTEYCLIEYPEKKADKFLQIDQKLISKYNANLSKDKTYYNKKKKYSNFKFLRCKGIGIILKTKGKINEKLTIDDVFFSVKKEKVCITIGPRVKLTIGYDHKNAVTVFLHNESYKMVKFTCIEYIDDKNYYKAINAFNNLNGLPAWGGIVSQKIKMKGQLIGKLKKNASKEQVDVLSSKMIINTKRTAVKVF